MLHVFLVNRSVTENAEIEIDPAGGKIESVQSAEVISGPGPQANNTYEDPGVICSRPLKTIKVSDGKALVQLPPLAVAAVTLNIS